MCIVLYSLGLTLEERDVAGLVSRVSGDALAELIGYERRYDLRAGVRAHIEALRQAPQTA